MSATMSRRSFVKAAAWGLADLALAGSIVGGDYALCYLVPHAGSAAGASTASDPSGSADAPWRARFADKFSAQPEATADGYRDQDVSIQITRQSYDSGQADTSGDGSYAKYGSRVSYVLADVHVSGIDCIKTAFAQDTYGVGYSEPLVSIADRAGAAFAVNGDSYSNNRHRQNGTIIRNGTVYRTAPSTEETCVLFRDGTMKVYPPEGLDPEQLVADGAWQSWVFGPSLLDAGRAKETFLTWDYIRRSHPRTAIGYFEPGHYCFLVVDGREPGVSRGMFLSEMAALFEGLGCQAAYNLDGGHCSFAAFEGQVANSPYKPSHGISDGICVRSPSAVAIPVQKEGMHV